MEADRQTRLLCVCPRARVLTLELTYMCCLTYIFDFESVFVLPRVSYEPKLPESCSTELRRKFLSARMEANSYAR